MALFPAFGRHSTPPGRTTERLAGRQQHRVRHRTACRQKAQEHAARAHMMAFIPVNCWNSGLRTAAAACLAWVGEKRARKERSAPPARISRRLPRISSSSASTSSVPRMPTSTCVRCRSACQGGGLGPGPGNPETRDAAANPPANAMLHRSHIKCHACMRAHARAVAGASAPCGPAGCWRHPGGGWSWGVWQEEAAQAEEGRQCMASPKESLHPASRPCVPVRSIAVRA